MALSLEKVPPVGRSSADLSPNNRGFAMAKRQTGPDEAVTGMLRRRRRLAIDNKPTPSYLSISLGWFAVFASNLPEKCGISGAPEAKSGRDDVVKAPAAMRSS
jgi:hypothetical protein